MALVPHWGNRVYSPINNTNDHNLCMRDHADNKSHCSFYKYLHSFYNIRSHAPKMRDKQYSPGHIVD